MAMKLNEFARLLGLFLCVAAIAAPAHAQKSRTSTTRTVTAAPPASNAKITRTVQPARSIRSTRSVRPSPSVNQARSLQTTRRTFPTARPAPTTRRTYPVQERITVPQRQPVRRVSPRLSPTRETYADRPHPYRITTTPRSREHVEYFSQDRQRPTLPTRTRVVVTRHVPAPSLHTPHRDFKKTHRIPHHVPPSARKDDHYDRHGHHSDRHRDHDFHRKSHLRHGFYESRIPSLQTYAGYGYYPLGVYNHPTVFEKPHGLHARHHRFGRFSSHHFPTFTSFHHVGSPFFFSRFGHHPRPYFSVHHFGYDCPPFYHHGYHHRGTHLRGSYHSDDDDLRLRFHLGH